MRTHIDWLSFTFSPVYDSNSEDGYARAIQAGLLYMFTPDVVSAYFDGAWRKQERARAPYTDSWADGESGLVCFASPNLNHATIEISGQGCERLIEMGGMEVVLHAAQERITRIDIATDINTEIAPTEFVAQLAHDRMRSSGVITSDTGQTCYIGSKQSERFARVYRYNPPHPRAHLLRVEHVFRRDHAKAVAKSIVENSLGSVETACGEAFGWNHPEWKTGQEPSADISVVGAEKNAGKTVSWLVRSVAPAFQRLVADGTIRDPEQFFRTYFMPEDGASDIDQEYEGT
jgi:hypothetical protein